MNANWGLHKCHKMCTFFLILRDLKVLSEGQAVVVNGKWVSSGHQEQLLDSLGHIISQHSSATWMPEGWNRDDIFGKLGIYCEDIQQVSQEQILDFLPNISSRFRHRASKSLSYVEI